MLKAISSFASFLGDLDFFYLCIFPDEHVSLWENYIVSFVGCRGIHSPTRTKNIGDHGRGLSQPELMGRETWFKWLESSVNEMVRECRIHDLVSVLFINKAMTTCMSPYDQTIDYKPSCLHCIFPFPFMSHVSSTSTVNHQTHYQYYDPHQNR